MTHKILIVLLSLGMLPQIGQIAVKNINNKLDFYFGILFLNVRGLLLVSLRVTSFTIEAALQM